MAPNPERVHRLAEAVRRAQSALTDTVESRDMAMLEANDDGWTLGQIAKAAGLARATVQQAIVNAAARRHGAEISAGHTVARSDVAG